MSSWEFEHARSSLQSNVTGALVNYHRDLQYRFGDPGTYASQMEEQRAMERKVVQEAIESKTAEQNRQNLDDAYAAKLRQVEEEHEARISKYKPTGKSPARSAPNQEAASRQH